MLRKTICAVLLMGMIVAPVAVRAQDEDSGAPFIYSTYFECDVADEGIADMVFESVSVPVYDAAVEDGTISAWGYLKHHTGGKWRRATYFIAPTTKAILAAQETIAGRVRESNPGAMARFSRVCGSHEDYIWRSITGSGGDGSIAVATSGSAGISQYHVCKMSQQERADEIVKTVLAPVYNAQVEAGNLAGWGWLEHQVGGEYRRLLTLRGEDHNATLDAWGEAINQMSESHEAEMNEFNEICYTHQDYMWDISHRTP